MEKSLIELKEELIDLMVHVHGRTYTFGWLKSSYLNPCDEQKERTIIQHELVNMKAKIELDQINAIKARVARMAA